MNSHETRKRTRDWRAAVLALGGLVALQAPAFAQGGTAPQAQPLKIGVMSDMAGPYADFAGTGSLVAAQMAVEEFGGKVLGRPIEIVKGDHQNKADVGSSLARKWFDVEGVEMITDVPNSAVALAVQGIGKEKDRIVLNTSAVSPQLTGAACSPTGAHWVSDSYALANGLTKAVLAQGGKTWFYLVVDYEGGYAQERESVPVVESSGGKVLGRVRHPLNTTDFGSFLLQAQASKAEVVALTNAGNDTINAIKQAAEFGIAQGGQRLVGMFVNITDIYSLGLPVAQGLTLMEGFYWDRDDQSRAFSQEFMKRHGKMPTQYQAGVYSAVSHYLKSVAAAGTTAAAPVMAKMRALPVTDAFARNGRLREDGRMVHDMYLVEVKKPGESKGPWDLYKILATIPGDQAFRPLDQGLCPLVKKPG